MCFTSTKPCFFCWPQNRLRFSLRNRFRFWSGHFVGCIIGSIIGRIIGRLIGRHSRSPLSVAIIGRHYRSQLSVVLSVDRLSEAIIGRHYLSYCHIVIEDALWLTSWSDVSLILIIVTDNWDQWIFNICLIHCSHGLTMCVWHLNHSNYGSLNLMQSLYICPVSRSKSRPNHD